MFENLIEYPENVKFRGTVCFLLVILKKIISYSIYWRFILFLLIPCVLNSTKMSEEAHEESEIGDSFEGDSVDGVSNQLCKQKFWGDQITGDVSQKAESMPDLCDISYRDHRWVALVNIVLNEKLIFVLHIFSHSKSSTKVIIIIIIGFILSLYSLVLAHNCINFNSCAYEFESNIFLKLIYKICNWLRWAIDYHAIPAVDKRFFLK